MMYINYLENIKIANGREWLENIYKHKYLIEAHKIERGFPHSISYYTYGLIEELLSPECTENIHIFLKEKYNLCPDL